MAPRNMGVKATVAICSVVGLMIIAQSVSNSARQHIETAAVGRVRNHSRFHHRHKQVQEVDSAEDEQTGESDDEGESYSGTETLYEQIDACKEGEVHNFFTDIEHSFLTMLETLDEEPIDTRTFLDCCSDLSAIFSKLSATAFAPVKSSFAKEMTVILTKYEMDSAKYATLESIVLEDVRNNNHKSSTSATDSIVWVTRSLLFFAEIFRNIENQEEFYQAVSLAYTSTLKQYHSFVVKTLFGMIGPAVPSKQMAIASFSLDEADVEKPKYVQCLYGSLDLYSEAIELVCENIENFIKTQGIVVMHRPPQ